MSTMDEKLGNERERGGRARCRLKQHLAHRWGFEVLESDAEGPTLVRAGAITPELWVRVGKDSGDFIMEMTDAGKREVQEEPSAEAWQKSSAPRAKAKRRTRKV